MPDTGIDCDGLLTVRLRDGRNQAGKIGTAACAQAVFGAYRRIDRVARILAGIGRSARTSEKYTGGLARGAVNE